jgi:hypothetical protein
MKCSVFLSGHGGMEIRPIDSRSGCYSRNAILQSIDFSLRSCEVNEILEGWSCISGDYVDIGGNEHGVERVVLFVAAWWQSLA